MAEPFEIEARWPDLFEGLTPAQRDSVVQPLASSWHEGWVPNRDDVALLSYDALVADPEAEVTRLCEHVGLVPRPALWEHVEARATHPPRVEAEPRAVALAEQVHAELAAARGRRDATAAGR